MLSVLKVSKFWLPMVGLICSDEGAALRRASG